MNKTEFIAAVAKKSGQTQAVTGQVVEAVFNQLSENLYQEEPTNIAGFGKFSTTKVDERPGRNPASGEAITIPAKNRAHFKPAKELKEYIQD